MEFDKYVLVTCHRRENFGQPLINICHAINVLSKHIKFIIGEHPNPGVKDIMDNHVDIYENVVILKPANYLTFINLMNNAYFIMSDSGGIEEEAACLGKPLLILRDKTERPEVLKHNAILVGTETKRIVQTAMALLNDKKLYHKLSRKSNLYGRNVSAKVVRFTKSILHWQVFNNINIYKYYNILR